MPFLIKKKGRGREVPFPAASFLLVKDLKAAAVIHAGQQKEEQFTPQLCARLMNSFLLLAVEAAAAANPRPTQSTSICKLTPAIVTAGCQSVVPHVVPVLAKEFLIKNHGKV